MWSRADELPTRLGGEDLAFWWADSPMQPTTMAMLLVLDRLPDGPRLRAAVARAIAAVPRLRQRVVDAPLDLTLPHWETDPTFDLDYHVRHHAVGGSRDLDELFRAIAPAYETPFDRSRPLWEARVYEGLRDGRAALFFKLHHAVADGVGANAIFAAMTDWDRDPGDDAPPPEDAAKGPWSAPPSLASRVADAVRDRIALDVQRAGAAAQAVAGAVRHPSRIADAVTALRSLGEVLSFDSRSPLRRAGAFGRARRLAGMDLPFEEVRRIRHALDGTMIDVILSIMARAMGKWYRAHGIAEVRDVMTLVPVNLRRAEEWTVKANVGNVATGLLVPLPVGLHHPVATFREVRRRVERWKADPAAGATPALSELCSVLGRRFVSWMGEATFGSVDFIVTNVPGILATRYLAGAAIEAAYPIAPVAMQSPASVALYGYRDRLFIGIDADETVMADVAAFRAMIGEAFGELASVARVRPSMPAVRGAA
jgi:diacylglycerol O-acyltransferase